MEDINTVGDYFKNLEKEYRTFLGKKTYCILRIDGRAFHTFTRGMVKPYSKVLANSMDAAAYEVCNQLSGVRFGFGQSDEYSFLFDDLGTELAEHFFGGNTQKISSVCASIFTAAFNNHVESGTIATFDARVFVVPKDMVEEYFIWRQRDAMRCSVNMIASTFLSHTQLHGKNDAQRKVMIEDIGEKWEKYPISFQRGRVICKVPTQRTVSFVHKKTKEETHTIVDTKSWAVMETTPVFKNGFLADLGVIL